MNLIEYSISLLAPHRCVICKSEGSPICSSCRSEELMAAPSCCFRCGVSTVRSSTCALCRDNTPLRHVWIAAQYKGAAKDIVAMLKFQRVKAAASAIADRLHECLPPLPKNVIVSPVPTVNSRVRMRGYDQAALIARQFAKKRSLPYRPTLRRVRSTRQVGANRRDRFRQLEDAFEVYKRRQVAGKHILLIDDVMTTGATLESAGFVLKANDAAVVDCAVFAH